VLLVDEILAVGDLKFQQKCLAKIAEMKNAGMSIIIVTHDMITAERICDKGILLKNGTPVFYGGIKEAAAGYYSAMNDKNFRIESPSGVKYKNLKIKNYRGREMRVFKSGDDIIAEFGFETERIINPSVHFSLECDPASYNGYSTYYDGLTLPFVDEKTVIKLRLKKVLLAEGEYTISLGLWDKEFLKPYCWDYESTGKIKILSEKKLPGRFEFEHEWKVKQGG
jgi:energy-coupling factor transporter ATP-binding protein EcfA2